MLADFCLLLGSNQGYLGVNQMCGDDDRKVKLRIWRGDRQTETAGSLLPTYSVFYFIIVNNNIYFGYFNVYTFNGLIWFCWGGVVKETGQQFLLGTHNTRKCVLRLHTDKNDSKVKTTPC